MKQTLVVILSCALFFTQPLKADEVTDVKNIVSKNVRIVIDLVRNKEIDKASRNRQIIETIEPFFDFETMALICLVKKHRRVLVKVKGRKQEFVDIFVQRLQDSYLEKLDLYTDEEVEIGEAKQKGKTINVITYLVSKDSKMEMVYKFRKSKKGWLVYDLEILGVSIVQTYRSQFVSFLKKNSMDELLKSLKTTDTFKMPDEPKS
jgi:phospholipid transport system substrate-binding protein